MGWLLFIFLFYFICLLVEHALVNVSAHDLELLRAEKTRNAQQALALGLEVRPSLAALLLTRILLMLLAGVLLAVFMLNATVVQTNLSEFSMTEGISLPLLWGMMGLGLALGLALLFWTLQKLGLKWNKAGFSVLFLKRLWWFAYFWKLVFSLFTQKEKHFDALKEGKTPETHQNAATHAASEKRELELLKSIVQFGDVTVKQVMQPRSKVVSLDFRMNFQELLEVVRKSEFSRLPVYDEDLDNITGILYVKDLVPHLDEAENFEWQPLIRTNVLMVPEAKRCSELLDAFKQQRMHMALVVDEYGGIAGIVTMEDILEEVTGDIRDEFDEESEIRYRKIDDFNYLFEGQTLLNDVCRLTGLAPGVFDPVRGASDTLAGLALELRGDIPLIGTEIAWNGFLLTVTIADKRRIDQLKLSLPKAAQA